MITTLLALALVAVALDDLRLRFLARQARPLRAINVLPDGVVLPETDDPRWRLTRGELASGKREVLVLGQVIVTRDEPCFLFIGPGKPIPGSEADEYARAVAARYRARLALESIEGKGEAIVG